MKFEFGLLLLCSLTLLLESCSESNKVSGGTIEDQNALLEKQVNDWYNGSSYYPKPEDILQDFFFLSPEQAHKFLPIFREK